MRFFRLLAFTAVVLGNSVFTSLAQSPSYFLEIIVDYPTTGMSDGMLIPHLVGNYPNPVEYKFDNSAVILYSDDTLANLDEAYFQQGFVIASAIDAITQEVLCYATLPYGLGTADYEVTCDILNAPMNLTDCDGSFHGGTTYTLVDTMLLWWANDLDNIGSAIQYAELDSMSWMNGLCPGFYQLSFYDYIGNGLGQYSFQVGSILPSSTAFDVEVFTTPTSADSCTGDAYTTVLGGVAPYQYVWDGLPGTSEQYYLCEGLHTLKVIDNNNDSATVLFGVADSSLWYSYVDPVPAVVDTVYFMAENCGLDFTIPVDSVLITFVDFYNDSMVAVGFEIYQDTVMTFVLDTASYGPPSYGNYLVDLTQFCLTKSLDGEVIKFNGNIIAYLDLDESNKDAFILFPNPATNMLYIESNSPGLVIITSLSGQKILETNETAIDVSTFTKGLYLFLLYDANGDFIGSRKISVQ